MFAVRYARQCLGLCAARAYGGLAFGRGPFEDLDCAVSFGVVGFVGWAAYHWGIGPAWCLVGEYSPISLPIR